MARMKKQAARPPEDSEIEVEEPVTEPPSAYGASDAQLEAQREIAAKPLTIRVRGMSATPPIKTMEPGGGTNERRYGTWRGQIPGEDVPEWAIKMGCTKNPGAFYWPAEMQAEYDVTLGQLAEIKADKNVVLSYDLAEEQMLRARVAPTMAAREVALKAAKLEAELAEMKARMTMLTAAAAAAEAEKHAVEAKARLAIEEARIRAGS